METELRQPVKIDWDTLTFSVTPTRSMYLARCPQDGSWKPGELVPYGDITISPAAGVLNYGQGLFEGMKAFRTAEGNIGIFRPGENARRVNTGCRRLCIPEVPEELFLDAIRAVVRDNEDYIPPLGKGALYLRPLVFGSGPVLGVKPAPEYTFLIYVSPVGPYFKEGFSGIHLLVTEEYHRAAQYGTGGVKAIGNYAGGMLPAKLSKAAGYAEVVYLDARREQYLEEVGAANFFLIKPGKVLATPELDGSILPGITRASVCEMAAGEFGYTVEERHVDIEEIFTGEEAFCSGTAAVITPILSMTYRDRRREFNGGRVGPQTTELYEALTGIVLQQRPDPYGWMDIL
jgi:branched-chain amino acid aminotransferase